MMTDNAASNVVKFPSHDDTVETLIAEALKADLDEAVLIGWQKDGGFYLSGSSMRADAALAILKIAERMIIDSLMDQT